MSLAFARLDMPHRIIGPPSLAAVCRGAHMEDLGYHRIDPHARMYVGSVQTLDGKKQESWMLEVTLVNCDEGHHILRENAWGRVLALFPNAKILAPTATPCRADGMGLGLHADGLVEVLIRGPEMPELIEQGYLTPFRVFAPPSDIDITNVPITSGGDFSPMKLSEAVHKSKTITGDVVGHYLRVAKGKPGLTFTVDIAAAVEMATAYRAAGVRAEVISGKTPARLRAHLMHQLRTGELDQVVNVDTMGEGTDVPVVEVVSDAAHTASYGRFKQRFGRMLRPAPGKTHGIYLDHVGNAARHMPRMLRYPQIWTLDRRDRRTRGTPDDVIPVRTCLNPEHPVRGGVCLYTYERVYKACPDCGFVPIPAGRGTPEAVDGELAEMSPELLARLRGEIDKPLVIPYGAAPVVVASVKKNYREGCAAQASLRDMMALYGGWRLMQGDDIGMTQRRWMFTFGCDVLTAKALNRSDAAELEARVRAVLIGAGVAVPEGRGGCQDIEHPTSPLDEIGTDAA
jgi:hypothetical protein